MNVDKINKPGYKSRVLIAPLDWGLGHATRCIPLIRHFLLTGCEVYIAAAGPSAQLLEKELPQIVILPLKGYGIRYGKSRNHFFAGLLWQLPRVIATVRYEKKWVKRMASEYQINLLVSDNRYGFYDDQIPSVFITHQLGIKTGLALLDRLAKKVNYRLINKFTACWVPDFEGPLNLAGELSHPATVPRTPLNYIGLLSRFSYAAAVEDIDLLIILSGPEPQRSIFEKLLLPQLSKTKLTCVLLRGLPSSTEQLRIDAGALMIHNHLPAAELNKLINRSKMVLSRSGYSTIMDLVAAKQRGMFVPTPGHGEQEYLAKYLAEKKIFPFFVQAGFDLEVAYRKSLNFNYSYNFELDFRQPDMPVFPGKLTEANQA